MLPEEHFKNVLNIAWVVLIFSEHQAGSRIPRMLADFKICPS